MKTVLVTGLRGKTGREIGKTLLQRMGVTVRGAGRTVTNPEVNGASVLRFDWEDPASWATVLAGVNSIYLVKPKTADPAQTVASFLRSAENVERVVLLSEIDAGNRDEATDERKVERVVETSPMAWTILRPNWFMQNFTEPSFYLEAIRDAGQLTVPSGGQPTSFVDTRDIAEVATAALLEPGHAGKTYTLTGPGPLTFAEVVALIGQAAGHRVLHIDPPLDDYLQNLKGIHQNTIEYYRRIYQCMRDGRTSIISADIERVTGHRPRDFRTFVEENENIWRRPSAGHQP